MDFDKELDARGLSCPLPILKTKKSLNEIASGQVLKVVATDPGSVKDFDAFANQTGQPAISLPLYENAAHLPIGVQLAAQYGREDLLLRVAAQLEEALPWSGRVPAVHA